MFGDWMSSFFVMEPPLCDNMNDIREIVIRVRISKHKPGFIEFIEKKQALFLLNFEVRNKGFQQSQKTICCGYIES